MNHHKEFFNRFCFFVVVPSPKKNIATTMRNIKLENGKFHLDDEIDKKSAGTIFPGKLSMFQWKYALIVKNQTNRTNLCGFAPFAVAKIIYHKAREERKHS